MSEKNICPLKIWCLFILFNVSCTLDDYKVCINIYFFCIFYLFINIVKILSTYLFARLSCNYFYLLSKYNMCVWECVKNKLLYTRNSLNYIYCVFISDKIAARSRWYLSISRYVWNIYFSNGANLACPLCFQLTVRACVRACIRIFCGHKNLEHMYYTYICTTKRAFIIFY